MDPCTQGLIGATFSSLFSKKRDIRKASLCGAIGGIAPDLDIFISSNNDQLLFIEYHRHFTHSLFFAPIGSIFVSLIIFVCFFKLKMSFRFIYLFAFIGFVSHGLLDSLTSYGTSLFWPFSKSRVALNLISIIDPVFTITLVFFLIFSLIKKSTFSLRSSIVFSFFYIFLCYQKNSQVKDFIFKISESRAHKIEKLIVKPTFGNIILWRSVYRTNDKYYVDAIYAPFFDGPKFRPGAIVNAIDKDSVFPKLKSNSIQRNDIRRFSFFSDDFIYIHPSNKFLIADLRYGSLPNDDKSLWGIEININTPELHADFKNLRDFDEKFYKEYWRMLSGNYKYQTLENLK